MEMFIYRYSFSFHHKLVQEDPLVNSVFDFHFFNSLVNEIRVEHQGFSSH